MIWEHKRVCSMDVSCVEPAGLRREASSCADVAVGPYTAEHFATGLSTSFSSKIYSEGKKSMSSSFLSYNRFVGFKYAQKQLF